MKTIIALLFPLMAFAADPGEVLITVTRNYSPIPKKDEAVTVAIDWNNLIQEMPALKNSSAVITDRNFGLEVPYLVVDVNADERADYLVFEYVFRSNEPIFSFLITSVSKKPAKPISRKITINKRLMISVLKPYNAIASKADPGRIAAGLVQTTLDTYKDPKDFPIYAPDRWNYEYSFFLLGSYKLGKLIGNPDFINYPRRWIDGFIKEDGGFREGVYAMDEYKLDDVIPARLAILFHKETGEPKYKSVVDTIITQLTRQPKTSDGGYWHKRIYEHQMWLDGIFMADVFSMHYAHAYNQPEWYDEAVHQIKLIYKHTVDDRTGLLYHGWDESKNPVWAHPEKGTSPEFWARAIGWYAMALAQCLDYLPADHPERNDVIEIFRNVCKSVKKVQHPGNHLWYQVIDKSDREDNWPETSATAMFAYAFVKGYNDRHLDVSFRDSAVRAYDALLDKFVFVDKRGGLHLDQTVKIGTLNPKTSKGDYQYYISTERRIDDYKGLASFLFASIELNR